MRSKIKTLAATMIAASLLTGCMTIVPKPTPYFDTAYESSNKKSHANNVMSAAGITNIRDARSSSTQSAVNQGGISTTGLTLGTALHAFADPASIGLNAAGFMNVLYWLNNPEAPESYSHIFAWTRVDPSKSGYQGFVDLQEQVVGQLIQSVEKHQSGVAIKPFEKMSKDSRGTVRIAGVVVNDPRCDPQKPYVPDCFVGFNALGGNYNIDHSGRFLGHRVVPTPDFVSSDAHQSMLYKGILQNGVFSKYRKQLKIDSLDTLALWRDTSQGLPDYVYLYLAPGRYTYRNEDQKVVKGKVPLVLNKGQIHLFATARG